LGQLINNNNNNNNNNNHVIYKVEIKSAASESVSRSR
jgi:hypothetical protein